MQNAVLTHWREGGLPNIVELPTGTAALSLVRTGIDVSPEPPETGAHVADVRYEDDICVVKLHGAYEPVLLDRFQHTPTVAGSLIGSLSREPNSRPTGIPPIKQPTELVLESGDTLWIDMFGIRFIQNSRYLQYLPAPYQMQKAALDLAPHFTGRFLNIFEGMLDPLALMLAQIERYFSPQTAPASILPYLASWFDLDIPVSLSTAEQRAVLKNAVEINRWRSTRKGLTLHIEASTGLKPEITEWYAARDGTPIPIAGELPPWMRRRGSLSTPRCAEMGCFSILLPAFEAAQTARPIEQLLEIVDLVARMHRPVHSAYEIWVQPNRAAPPIRHIPSARD